MGKYDGLRGHLRAQAKDQVAMTFAEIERVVGVPLPKSQNYQAWWSNSTSNNVMTQVWLDAGYRTEQVDVAGRKLVFRRAAPNHAGTGMHEEPRMFEPPDSITPSPKKTGRHPLVGCMKGTFTIVSRSEAGGSAPSTEEGDEWEEAAHRKADLYLAGIGKYK